MTAETIAKKTGRNLNNVRVMLKKLRDAGAIECHEVVVAGRKKWVYRDGK